VDGKLLEWALTIDLDLSLSPATFSSLQLISGERRPKCRISVSKTEAELNGGVFIVRFIAVISTA
jgi:hypothetical protein